MYYLVIEVQVNNGTEAHLVTSHTDINQAWSKYYLVLSSASVSNLDSHSCTLIDSAGYSYEHKCFYKKQEEEVTE